MLSTASRFLDALRRAAVAAALPLVGVVRDDAADGRAGRTVVLLAHGDGEFWERFVVARRQAAWLAADADPLDHWTRVVVADVVAAAQAVVPLPCRVAFPTDAAVDFRGLGLRAGLGVSSRLGILLHPEFGPWLALRAAVFVPIDLPPTPALDGYAPCDTCRDRPCEPACPVHAISADGWNAPACATHRRGETDTCGAGCFSRLACPIGTEHRLPPEARTFHASAVRRLMRKAAR